MYMHFGIFMGYSAVLFWFDLLDEVAESAIPNSATKSGNEVAQENG